MIWYKAERSRRAVGLNHYPIVNVIGKL